MTSCCEQKISVQEIGENLANFSLDRESVLYALSRLPENELINVVTVQYEIQLLKILSVGWAISYFIEDHPEKNIIIKKFWDVLFEFSKNISSVTSLSIGKEVDYFRTLKDRIDYYINVLSATPDVNDPVAVIGESFADLCGSKGNANVIMAGSRVFHNALEGVKHCFESFFSNALITEKTPTRNNQYDSLGLCNIIPETSASKDDN